jgi:hypothetical protein
METRMAKEPRKVRYQVLAPVFIGGSLVEPQGRKDVFVEAEPGLEGKALKLAPLPAASSKDAGKDGVGEQPPAT